MIFDFAQYMENVAISLKDIQHTNENRKFYKISSIFSLEGFLYDLRNASETIMLIDTSVEGSIGTKGSDNFMDNPSYKFYILKKSKLSDSNQEEQIKKECKAIGMKILSKMLKDKTQGIEGLLYLDFSQIPYITVGPLANQWYGVEFFFTVRTYNNELVYNPNDWL